MRTDDPTTYDVTVHQADNVRLALEDAITLGDVNWANALLVMLQERQAYILEILRDAIGQIEGGA